MFRPSLAPWHAHTQRWKPQCGYLICSQSTPSKKGLFFISSTPGAPILCSHSQQNLEKTGFSAHSSSFRKRDSQAPAHSSHDPQTQRGKQEPEGSPHTGPRMGDSATSESGPWLSRRQELLGERSEFPSSSSPSCTSLEGSQSRMVGTL